MLELLKKEEGIMEASRTLDEISRDRAMWMHQIREDILAIDRNSEFAAAEERGIKKGIADGKAEEKERIARMMKENHVSADVIERCTGLGEDKIKSL